MPTTTHFVSGSASGSGATLSANLTDGITLNFGMTGTTGAFERINVWVDGAVPPIVNAYGFGSQTASIPPLTPGTHHVEIAASYSSVSIDNPGVRVVLTYDYDGSSFTAPSAPTTVLHPAPRYSIRSVFDLDYIAATGGNSAVGGGFPTGFAAAGLTHIEEGFFDGTNAGYGSYALGMAQFNARLSRAQSAGFKIVALGDDATRNGAMAGVVSGFRATELHDMMVALRDASPSVAPVIVWADEADLFVTDTAAVITSFLAIANPVTGIEQVWTVHLPGHTTVSTGTKPATYWQSQSTTEGPYYDTNSSNKYATGLGPSVNEFVYWANGNLNNTNPAKPYYSVFSITGDNGGVRGVTPSLVSAELFYFWIRGAAAYRAYYLGGTKAGQLGGSPLGEGTDRWAAMSKVFNLFASLEASYDISGVPVTTWESNNNVIGATRGPVTIKLNICEASMACSGGTPYKRIVGSTDDTSTWTGVLPPRTAAIWIDKGKRRGFFF